MSIYERINIVCADLARLDISNEDPMRYSKRRCKSLAHDALEKGVYQAEEFIQMISTIEDDSKEIKGKP